MREMARRVFEATLRSAAFLTRAPIPGFAFAGPRRSLADDAAAFPVVGVLLAIPAGGILLAGAAFGLSPDVTALLAVAALIAMTGALHEDGLADVADGLGSPRPRDRAIAIMRDSRIGAYGTIALVLAIGLRILLLGDIVAEAGPLAAGFALAAAGALSRATLVQLWSSLPPASEDGSISLAGRPTPLIARGALGLALFFHLACIVPFWGPGPWLVSLPVVAITYVAYRRFLKIRLGGVTGDTLGSCQQLAELAALLALTMSIAAW